MNLLRIQDALKNASDQQLMQLMQAPDSTAPSYLVLSEMRRRKDMRAQQPPEGQSNRTVAEELLSQDDGGIRNIVAHDEPEAQDGADEMAAGGLASLRRYAEGGVVRMQTGGQPPPILGDDNVEYAFRMGSQDPVIFGRPLHSYSLQELERLRSSERYLPGASRGAIPMEDINRRIGVLRGRAQPRFQESPALDENVPSLEGIGSRELANRTYESFASSLPVFGGEEGGPPTAERPTPTTTTTAQPGDQQRPPAAQPPAAQPPAAQPPAAQQSPRPAAPQPPRPAQPAAPAAQPAQGIGALRPTGAQGDEPAQSSVQFTDRLSPLFERMREGRVDASARRNEALNMAMIEAGLRIASSRNPSLAGALGEGAAPAVQSYGQQLGQIRADQRQDLRDELQGALAQNQNDYYRGRLSQQEFATRQQMIIERLRQDREDSRTGSREAGANARNAATVAAQNRSPEAQRLWEFMHPGQTFDPNNAAHVEGMNRVLGRGRDPNEAREQRLTTALQRDPEIMALSRRLETLSTLTGEAGDRQRALVRQQLDAARRRVEQSFATGAGTGGAGGAGPVLNFDPATGNVR